MKCIIIEDQPPAQRILKKYIEDLGTLELSATFSSAIDGMAFLRTHTVDLIFLDIHLPKISGIDFLKSLARPPAVIFTTAFPDYALESYDLDVVDYLLKPFSFARFVKAVAKVPVQKTPVATETVPEATPEHFFIKSGYEYVRVTIADILYIKSDADYTELRMHDGKKHLSTEPLRHWEGELDPARFARVHKSYIVHTDKIVKLSSGFVYLSETEMLPIGRAYKDDFIARFL